MPFNKWLNTAGTYEKIDTNCSIFQKHYYVFVSVVYGTGSNSSKQYNRIFAVLRDAAETLPNSLCTITWNSTWQTCHIRGVQSVFLLSRHAVFTEILTRKLCQEACYRFNRFPIAPCLFDSQKAYSKAKAQSFRGICFSTWHQGWTREFQRAVEN